MNRHTGSDFDEFLRDEGILEETTAHAQQRLLALWMNDTTSNTHKTQPDDMELLLCEIATWEAASIEDALKLEKMLAVPIE